jgi:rod shape-determining protein MreD
VALAIAVALALQTTLARFLTGRTTIVDLVLVVVVYVALTGGSVAGLVAGAVGGLAQDALSTTGVSFVAAGSGVAAARSIIGIGGLAKTVVGFVTGIVGTQFIVTGVVPRFVVFFLATLAHATMFLGLYAILDPRYGGTSYGGVANQAVGNAVVGVVMIQAIDVLPGFLERRRALRGRMRMNRRLD